MCRSVFHALADLDLSENEQLSFVAQLKGDECRRCRPPMRADDFRQIDKLARDKALERPTGLLTPS